MCAKLAGAMQPMFGWACTAWVCAKLAGAMQPIAHSPGRGLNCWLTPATWLVGREPRLGGEGGWRRGPEAESDKAFHGVITWDRKS